MLNVLNDSSIIESNIQIINKILLFSKWLSLLNDTTLISIGKLIKRTEYTTATCIKERDNFYDGIIFIDEGKVFKTKDNQIPKSFDSNSLNNLSDDSKIREDVFESNYSGMNFNDNILEEYSQGGLLGEKELFVNLNPKYSLITYNKKTVIYSISLNVIKCFLGKNMIEYIKDEVFKYTTQKTFNLSEAKLISFLGKGSYGCVNLIKIKGKLYAMKSLSKQKLTYKASMIKYVEEEKNNLKTLKSPFILKLESTLKDKHFCHLLTEYVIGTPLDDIVKNKLFFRKSEECLFYFCNLIICLEVLSKEQIIHRDIKPANIIIQKNGFLKLIDFGLSKKLKDFTYTIIGSPYFVAPEIIKGLGYSITCDYWATGITLFKMYFGKYPFGEHSNTIMEVYKEISENELSFPNINDDQVLVVKRVISKILNKKSSERPTSTHELSKVLPNVKWDDIMNMNLEPPFKPVIDNSNMILYNEADSSIIKNLNGNITNCEGTEYNANKILNHFAEGEKAVLHDDIF